MKLKLPYDKARYLAETMKETLKPVCQKIEIAGSIRRHRPEIGDIEIVAIPKFRPDLGAQLNLFGDAPRMVSALDLLLDKLVLDDDNFRRGGKNGVLYKNFSVKFSHDGSRIGLDLFITTPEQWGYILALRTGPGAFNKAWVTQQSKGGLLPDMYHFAGGWLIGPGGKIATPDEDEFFELILGCKLNPELRDEWYKYFDCVVGF